MKVRFKRSVIEHVWNTKLDAFGMVQSPHSSCKYNREWVSKEWIVGLDYKETTGGSVATRTI